jgi:hypothetical protein
MALLVGSFAIPAQTRVESWPLPSAAPAAQPNLSAARNALYLSWIEPDADGHQLRYARDAGAGFDPPITIARGRRWFVNWADFPALTVFDDGRMAAHILQKSADAPYAYDVRLTDSIDGRSWSEPRTVHDDGTTTEHGFVSLWPWSEREVAIAWLDGRDTAASSGGGGHADHASGSGAMTLRGAVFGPDGKQAEWELDSRTCDCCQTDVALAAAGPVLVYRDRDAQEIRDIAITRWRDGAWTVPRLVHDDRWYMPGCPVNGPAVAAAGADIYVAWYTMDAEQPQLRLAHSDDDGERFGNPWPVAIGGKVLGRVDLALDAESVYVSWLEEEAQTQTLWLARFDRRLSQAPERVQVARMARGRGAGFPRMGLRAGVAHLVWTDVEDKVPRLRGARVSFTR